MIKGLFSKNQYKYRKFDYQPMYYDARKEKLSLKIKSHQIKEGDDSKEAMEVRKEMLRSQISSSWNTKETKTSFFESNYRSIIIIGILGLAAYYILFKLDISGFLEKYI